MISINEHWKSSFYTQIKNLVLEFEDGTILQTKDFALESMELEQAISEVTELKFGQVVAACFKIKVKNTKKVYKNLWFTASIVFGENTLKLGRFCVYEDATTQDKKYKQIVAYDKLFWIMNADVSEWYSSLSFPITVKEFRDSFFTHIGISQEDAVLPNDSFPFNQTIETNGVTGLKILKNLCEINATFGCINNEGQFKYIILDTDTVDDTMYKWSWTYGSLQYEEFDVEPITKVTIRENSDDIGVSVGEEGNTYFLQDNFLLYGATNTQLQQVAQNFLNMVKTLTYTPASLKCKGAPWREVGDVLELNTDDRTFRVPILHRVLTGTFGLKDSYEAEGTQTHNEVNQNSVTEEIKKIRSRTNVLSRTLDETRSEITRVETDLQKQIDGAIETYSDNYVPTLLNAPAYGWTTDEEKDKHLGDLYHVNSEGGDYAGFYYRFEKTSSGYQWTLLKDTEITKALKEAEEANQKAQEVADDLSANYSTTVQMNSAIKQAADEIDLSVSKLLQGYSTTEQMNAAIKLSADGINTEVSKKVGSNEIISKINQSPESVVINANRIALQGAVTFSSLDVATQSIINTANNNANVAISTANTASTNANNAMNAFNNLEIGTRNLLYNTNQGTANWAAVIGGGGYTHEAVTAFGRPAVKITTSEVSTSYYVWCYTGINYAALKNGGTYTLSFDIYPSVDVIVGVIYAQANSSNCAGTWGDITCPANVWTHWELTTTFNADPNNGQWIYIMGLNVVGEFTIANMMLVEGTKTGTWTPAPEDVDAGITSAQNIANTASAHASTALSTANANDAAILNWCVANDKTYINGGKIHSKSILTKSLNVDEIFSNSAVINKLFTQDITASGTITGVTIVNNDANSLSSIKLTAGKLYTYNSTTGYNGISISGSKLTVYAWDDDGTELGYLLSARNATTGERGTYLVASYGTDIGLGVKASASSSGFTYAIKAYYDDGVGSTILSKSCWKHDGTFETTGNLTAKSKIIAIDSVYSDGEFISYSASAFRSINGNYGAFWYNDGAYYHLMLTNAGDLWGSYNNLRPFYINMESGSANFGHDVGIGGTLWCNNQIRIANNVDLYCEDTNGIARSMVAVDSSNIGYLGWGVLPRLHVGQATNTGRLQLFSRSRIDLLPGGSASANELGLSLIKDDAQRGCLRGTLDNTIYLGNYSYRYAGVFLSESPTVSSDRRLKDDIKDLDEKYIKFIDLLIPKSFYSIYDNDKETRKRRIGYIAQEVEEALLEAGLTLEDCNFLHKEQVEREDYTGIEYSLSYDDIAVLVHAKVKRQDKVVEGLKNRILVLESQVLHLQSQLQQLGA